ncbi:MAG TPA: MerR family transcriptional regulator [Polyangiaceae bacterium]|nr:MerR family transcriptional regulator [Polyangiaceae bacterium]
MARSRQYQVKEVAALANVSVRTLHHYDAIGLLEPSGRTEAGYRLYGDADLLRLQQILLGRELGLSLEAIRRSLDDPKFDRRQALLLQRAELEARSAQTAAMLRAVDAALALLDDAGALSSTTGEIDMKQLFEGFDPREHEAETEERWGNTEAFRESQRRTAQYTKEDWQRFAAEQSAIYAEAFAALSQGKPPGDARALAVAERHRACIDRWFYPCNHEMHRGLADLYEQDARFAASIDRHGAGLTGFLVAAIRENARLHGCP